MSFSLGSIAACNMLGTIRACLLTETKMIPFMTRVSRTILVVFKTRLRIFCDVCQAAGLKIDMFCLPTLKTYIGANEF